MKCKRRIRRHTRACLAGILALMMAVSVLPAVFVEPVAAAEDNVIEILPYQNGESIDDSQWGFNSLTHNPETGRLEATPPTGQMKWGGVDLPSDMSEVKKLVILAKAGLGDPAGTEEIRLGKYNNAAKTGSSEAHLLARVTAVNPGLSANSSRIRFYNKEYAGSNTKHLGQVQNLQHPFSRDIAAVITNSGGGQTVQYYVNGIAVNDIGDDWNYVASYAEGKTSDWDLDPTKFANADHIDFIVRANGDGTATSYFDDLEVFAVTGDTAPAVEYQGLTMADGSALTGSTIGQTDSFALKFNTPIIQGSLEDAITINGEPVASDRLTLSDDRRSVIVAPPGVAGYDGNLSVAIADGKSIKGYAGGSCDSLGSVTLTTESVSVLSVMPYQDFETNYDESQWNKPNHTTYKGLLAVEDGKLKTQSTVQVYGHEWAYPDGFMEKITDGTIKKIIVLGTMEADEIATSGNARIQASLTNTIMSAGSETQRLVSLASVGSDGYRFRSYNKENNDNKEISHSIALPYLTDVAIVIEPDEGGTIGTTTTIYENGALSPTENTDPRPITLEGTNAFRFSQHNNAVGYFDNLEILAVVDDDAVLEFAEVPLTDENGDEIAEVGDYDSFMLNFNFPIIASSLENAITINGTAVEAGTMSLSADRRSVIVTAPFGGWNGVASNGELNISVSDDLQGYVTTESEARNFTLSVSETPSPAYADDSDIISILPYQDFADGDPEGVWNMKNGSPIAQDGYLELTSTSTGGWCGHAVEYPAAFREALAGGKEAYLVIRANMMLKETQTTTGTEVQRLEIALATGNANANASSSKRRLVHLATAPNGKQPSVRVNTSGGTDTGIGVVNTDIGEVTFGDWAHMDVVIHITDPANAAGTVTYYLNGQKGAEGSLSLGNNEQYGHIRFSAQNFLTAGVDDLEIYAVTGGKVPQFKYNDTLVGEAGSAGDAIDPDEGIELGFSSDMIKSGLVNAAGGGFRINGEIVSADRISVSPNGNGVIIAPPAGGWDAQTTYTVKSAGWISDMLGTYISSAVNTQFSTGGDIFSAEVKDSSRANGTASATVALKSADQSDRTILIIMAEYSGEGDLGMLKQAAVKTVKMTTTNRKQTPTVSMENVGENSTIRVFVWEGDNLNPVLNTPYTVE